MYDINEYFCCDIICRLLDVLAGRKDPAGLKGDVIVDGKKQPENFKCMSGYVVEVSGKHKTLSQCRLNVSHRQNGPTLNQHIYVQLVMDVDHNDISLSIFTF